MKNKKIVLLSILLFLMVGITSALITAWLTDTENTGSTTFEVGDISYTWSGEMIDNSTKIVPGQELIAATFTLQNASTVSSELRIFVTIEGEYIDETEIEDAISYFSITFGSNWTQYATDGKYYYGSYATPTEVEVGSDPITVVTSLMLDGSKVGNAFSKANFTITLTFEAKQKMHVNWEQLGSIDFETGLA